METEIKYKHTTFLLNLSINNKIEDIDNLINYLLNNIDKYIELSKNNEWNDINIKSCDISYIINKEQDIETINIYIMIKIEHLIKIKLYSERIQEELNNKLNLNNICCSSKILKHNFKNIEEYISKQNISKYPQQKQAIYKWREANKAKYLLKQHQYNMNKMMDPEYKKANLERIKLRNKRIKEEELKITGIKKKVGRPSKYENLI